MSDDGYVHVDTHLHTDIYWIVIFAGLSSIIDYRSFRVDAVDQSVCHYPILPCSHPEVKIKSPGHMSVYSLCFSSLHFLPTFSFCWYM